MLDDDDHGRQTSSQWNPSQLQHSDSLGYQHQQQLLYPFSNYFAIPQDLPANLLIPLENNDISSNRVEESETPLYLSSQTGSEYGTQSSLQLHTASRSKTEFKAPQEKETKTLNRKKWIKELTSNYVKYIYRVRKFDIDESDMKSVYTGCNICKKYFYFRDKDDFYRHNSYHDDLEEKIRDHDSKSDDDKRTESDYLENVKNKLANMKNDKGEKIYTNLEYITINALTGDHECDVCKADNIKPKVEKYYAGKRDVLNSRIKSHLVKEAHKTALARYGTEVQNSVEYEENEIEVAHQKLRLFKEEILKEQNVPLHTGGFGFPQGHGYESAQGHGSGSGIRYGSGFALDSSQGYSVHGHGYGDPAEFQGTVPEYTEEQIIKDRKGKGKKRTRKI